MFFEKFIFGCGITEVEVRTGRRVAGSRRPVKHVLFAERLKKAEHKKGTLKAKILDGGSGRFATSTLEDWIVVHDDQERQEARITNIHNQPLCDPLKPGETFSRDNGVGGEELRFRYRGKKTTEEDL